MGIVLCWGGGERGGGSKPVDLSSLLSHDTWRSAELTLDLLTGPAGRFYRPWGEVAVGLSVLDHGGQPVLAEGIHKLAVRVGIGQIAAMVSTQGSQKRECGTYPITPIAARINDSLRFISLAMRLSSWKID